MYCDLGVLIDPLNDQSRRDLFASAVRLGYDTVAANRTVSGTITNKDVSDLKPLSLESLATSGPGVNEAARFHQGLLRGPPGHDHLQQLSRLTLVTDIVSQANALNGANPLLASFDLVAIQPTSQAVFARACASLEVDIITLDLFQRLPYRLRPHMIKQASQRGVFFEVSYSPALSDPATRRQLFSNARTLLAMTRGRNVIVTSRARQPSELRAPHDVANLATLFGLAFSDARAALSQRCREVISHGQARRATHLAAIRVEPLPARTELMAPCLDAFEVPPSWDSSAPLHFVEAESSQQVNPSEVFRTPQSRLGVPRGNASGQQPPFDGFELDFDEELVKLPSSSARASSSNRKRMRNTGSNKKAK
eukprot:jgi/Mesen1/5039/ME000025S04445